MNSSGTKKSHLAIILTSVLLVALLIFLLINHTAVIDTFKGIGYNPTPDALAIKTSLNLTADGERICAAKGFAARIEGGLLTLEMTDEEGRTHAVQIALRCAE